MEIPLEPPRPNSNGHVEDDQESNLEMAMNTLSLPSNSIDVASHPGVRFELQSILEHLTESTLAQPPTFHPFPRLPTELQYRIISPLLVPRLMNIHLTHLTSGAFNSNNGRSPIPSAFPTLPPLLKITRPKSHTSRQSTLQPSHNQTTHFLPRFILQHAQTPQNTPSHQCSHRPRLFRKSLYPTSIPENKPRNRKLSSNTP